VTGTLNHVLNVVVDPSGKYLYALDEGDPTTTRSPTDIRCMATT
jgi:hypothetical protein